MTTWVMLFFAGVLFVRARVPRLNVGLAWISAICITVVLGAYVNGWLA